MAAGSSHALNLKQVAATLGVHYMTAYRYVRTGRLAARRLGSGWVVEANELEAFSARSAANALTGPGTARSAVDDLDTAWRLRLQRTLVVGDEIAGWRILELALAAGYTPAQCYLDLLVGAIDEISGRSGLRDAPVAAEYLAISTAARLVARLGARFRRPGRARGTVVFGAPLGEHHTLAISVVADLVRLEGFSCLELGADVPPEAFAGAAADAYRLVAVGVGLTTVGSVDPVRQIVEAVHSIDARIPVVIGGQAANDETATFTGADAWAADGRHAVEIFGDLVCSRRSLWLVSDSDDRPQTG